VPFWGCAALHRQRIRLGLDSLERGGFEAYAPKIRAGHNGATQLLFPSYAFIRIEAQWHLVQHSPGVIGLVLHDGRPARVADGVIADLRSREGPDGLVVLPTAPKPRGLRRGDRLRITQGPLRDQFGIYAGQRAHERVAILLTLFGAQRSLVLPRSAVMQVPQMQVPQAS
jgi:transcription antitermination factor NusG